MAPASPAPRDNCLTLISALSLQGTQMCGAVSSLLSPLYSPLLVSFRPGLATGLQNPNLANYQSQRRIPLLPSNALSTCPILTFLVPSFL